MRPATQRKASPDSTRSGCDKRSRRCHSARLLSPSPNELLTGGDTSRSSLRLSAPTTAEGRAKRAEGQGAVMCRGLMTALG